MKKFLGILVLSILWCSDGYAEKFKCFYKNGFVTEGYKFQKKINFENPSNTLIFIYNHGDKTERSVSDSKNCPFSKRKLVNVLKLTKEDFGAKKNYLYIVNTQPLYGDAYKDRKSKTKWKAFPVGTYSGKTKIEKKMDLMNKIIDNFYKMGIKPENIIMSGKSCGGWLTLMYVARHPEKVRGGIAYHPACYGRLTEFKIWTTEGQYKYWKDENWKCPNKDQEYACAKSFFNYRMANIKEITNAKNLKVAVVHNEDDPYEGKTSLWLKKIESIELIETPTKNSKYKINGKSCVAKDAKKQKAIGHNIHRSHCMPEFFPRIVKYLNQ